MTTYNFKAEEPENYDQKCCCVLVLDVSSSMTGNPIKELNDGLSTFTKDIKTDSTTSNRLEVAIIAFNENAKVLQAPSLVTNFTMPTLIANGGTKIVDGIKAGIEMVKSRKSWYKETGQPYYRPWVILMTDGDPDDLQNVTSVASEIKNGMDNKEFIFYAVGVQGADMKKLNEISHPTMPAAQLKGLNFSEFFRWLSASMTTVTNSNDGEKVNLPSPAAWMAGFSI
ncbi:MAG: VWA domain-containing protein [Sphingobacteriaceae bacterium]|nr:VWA domain-containing protein [Sphingobacteriaceae bacterium]